MDERERMKISDIKEVLKYQLYLINYTHNSQVFARIWYIIFMLILHSYRPPHK